MNHCHVSADERRHAHEEGMKESRQAIIDQQADSLTDRIASDLLSARKDNLTTGYYNLKFSGESLALLQLIINDLPDEVFGLAQELAKQDMESRHDF